MRRRLRRNRETPDTEINITAFMNLMVVLVPFLLVMAVFSRITILELDLPEGGTAATAEPAALELEVIVRGDGLTIADHVSGDVQRLAMTGEGYDLVGLTRHLQQLKARHPDALEATILLEPQVAYEHLVAVMDTVRAVPVERDGEWVQAELFPEISVGEAPAGRTRS
jgi:biopolymer transport protein ExbD